jgi:putrescine transport system substrate-binding protein
MKLITRAWLAGLVASLALAGCGKKQEGAQPAADAGKAPAAAPAEEKVVNVYNWSDYIDPKMLEQFTAETGIKVNYDVFDSNEVLQTKLLAGNTGYDVVVPSASFLETQIKAGVFRKLDRAKLPH